MSVQITRLAVQATAKGPNGVEGWIFFKVTLPADFDEATGGRWGLFPAPAPLTREPPTIHSLPLPRAPAPNSPLATATSLLSLTSGTTYPPRVGSNSTVSEVEIKPYLEVSNSRQVYICVKAAASTSQGRTLKRKDSFAGLSTDGSGTSTAKRRVDERRAVKQEWLVTVPFLSPLESGYAEGVCAITMHIPRCLSNLLRLRISYPALSDADEGFDVTTEPRTLLAPTGEPERPLPKNRHLTLRDPNEEGWEDGELPDATNRSLGLDEDDDGEESLQGRFPSTSTLHIAWSPALPGQLPISHARLGALATLPALPVVELSSPSIIKCQLHTTSTPSIAIHQTIPVSISASQQQQYSLHLQSHLPPDWAWSNLTVSGKGLGQLRSWVTGDTIGEPGITEIPAMSSDDEEVEDSFATVRGASSSSRRRNLAQGPSLLRQSLPTNEISVDDFSFEAHAHGESGSLATTPRHRTALPQGHLTDEKDLAVTIDTGCEPFKTGIVIEGTICPLSHCQHVIPGQPLEIPFVTVAAVHGRQPCQIHLPATAVRVVDLAQETPTFSWPRSEVSRGELDNIGVVVKPTAIGTHLVWISGRLRDASRPLVEFALPYDGDLRLLGAAIDGRPVKRGLTTRWRDWMPAGHAGRIAVFGLNTGGQVGICRVLVETTSANDADGRVLVPLPVWKHQSAAHVTVTLEDDHVHGVTTNLSKSVTGHTYSGASSISSPAHISYRPSVTPSISSAVLAVPSKAESSLKLISFKTFTVLTLLYILASVVIEVHHLRRELSTQNQHVEQYFAKQTRTLDGWESRIHEQLTPVFTGSTTADGTTAIGRPNDPRAFDKLLRHPAVTIAVSGVRRFLHVLKFLLTG